MKRNDHYDQTIFMLVNTQFHSLLFSQCSLYNKHGVYFIIMNMYQIPVWDLKTCTSISQESIIDLFCETFLCVVFTLFSSGAFYSLVSDWTLSTLCLSVSLWTDDRHDNEACDPICFYLFTYELCISIIEASIPFYLGCIWRNK